LGEEMVGVNVIVLGTTGNVPVSAEREKGKREAEYGREGIRVA